MKKDTDWNEIKKNIREEISEEIYSVKKGFEDLKPNTKVSHDVYLEIIKKFN